LTTFNIQHSNTATFDALPDMLPPPIPPEDMQRDEDLLVGILLMPASAPAAQPIPNAGAKLKADTPCPAAAIRK
jgi:hypothetical protein